MRLLITGASGLYGSKLAELAIQRHHSVWSGFSRDQPKNGIALPFDVSTKAQVEKAFMKAKPDVVVHAASFTDVDKCETERALCWKINVEGTRNVVEEAKKNHAFLVYISTDYVFNGEKGQYTENDKASPLNYYGLTKLTAETLVQEHAVEYCIARPCVIYGASPATGKVNFVLWVINKLSHGESVKIVTDQYITPTLNTNLADMTLEIAERRLKGIFHVSGATRLSRYDLAEFIAQTFSLNSRLLMPTTLAEMTWVAKRPRDSSLDTSKAQQTLNTKPLAINESGKQLKKEVECSNF